MASDEQEHSILIQGTIEDCWNEICDFEAYPEWQKALKVSRVDETDAEGRGKIVEFLVESPMKDIRYVLDYEYDTRKHELTWTFVEGDVNDVQGSFTFKEDGKGTEATYRLYIDAGWFVPKAVLSNLMTGLMKGCVKALRKRVESKR